MKAFTRSFVRRRDGSVAVVGALSATLMFAAAGLAVDYANALRIRGKLQSALDAAVLAASNVGLSEDQRQVLFESKFNASYGTQVKYPDKLTFQYSQEAGGAGRATLKLPTYLMRVVGFNDMNIATASSAKIDGVDIEVVFALDISGSMRAMDMGGGTRLSALKAASTKLIDTLVANRSAGQNIKFAVVPFNMAVNIGTDNSDLVSNTNHPLFAGTSWGGCVLERRGANASTDDYNPGSIGGAGKWPAHIWPPAPNSGSSCLNPSNGTNSAYNSVEPAPLGRDPWRPGPNFNCPRYPISRLTASDSDARSSIDALDAWGNMGTTIGPAVGWALRLLSPSGPFQDGAPFSPKTRKIMVVVTDGEMVTDGGSGCSSQTNTSQPYRYDPAEFGLAGRVLTTGPTNDSFTPYGYLLDSDPNNQGLVSALDADRELDRLSIAACSAAKSRSATGAIEIFTIAASSGAGPGTRAQTVLSQCASSADHFIYAADAADLEAAFDKIAERSLKLRLTR